MTTLEKIQKLNWFDFLTKIKSILNDLLSSSAGSDATTTTKGNIKLAGDLAGTADLPTVPGLASKQATLVSGTNIKTINSATILGSGNIVLATIADTKLIAGLPTYADNAAAVTGGLALNGLYKTATGELRIRI